MSAVRSGRHAQPLVDVANLSQFKARINVVESDAASVDKGKKAQIALNPFPTEIFTGTITNVATAAQQSSRRDPRKYFECEVVLNVPTELLVKLKPGMKLRADILVGSRKRAIVLPKSAVIKKDGEFSVFTGDKGSYKEVPVKIVDGDYGFYVLEGLKSGQEYLSAAPVRKAAAETARLQRPGRFDPGPPFHHHLLAGPPGIEPERLCSSLNPSKLRPRTWEGTSFGQC